jgi:hypothetical protein
MAKLTEAEKMLVLKLAKTIQHSIVQAGYLELSKAIYDTCSILAEKVYADTTKLINSFNTIEDLTNYFTDKKTHECDKNTIQLILDLLDNFEKMDCEKELNEATKRLGMG